MNRPVWPIVAGVIVLTAADAGHCAPPQTNAVPPFNPEHARQYLEALAPVIQEQTDPTAEAALLHARVQSQLGFQDRAERWAQTAVQRDPTRADVHSFLADLFIRQDRMTEASQSLERALQLDPNTPGAHRRLGMVLDRLGDREHAAGNFERAIAQQPGDATAHLLLGRLRLDQDRAADARGYLQRACELDPSSANAFYVRSQAEVRLGDTPAAQASLATFQELKRREKARTLAENLAYDDAKAMEAFTADVHTQVASILLHQHKAPWAEAHLRQAAQIRPTDLQSRERLAALLLHAGRFAECRPVCEELVALAPNQPAYRVTLGTLLLQLKQWPAAVQQLERALALDPKLPDALNNLARALLGGRQDLPHALELARRLVQVQPIAASYDLLGWALYANGQTNDAIAATAQALSLEPTNTVYQERLRRLRN